MADKQAAGDNTLPTIGASPRQRFSLISLFASNQNSSRSSFREKRQKSGKKSKSKATAETQTTPTAATSETVVAAPPSRTRLDSSTGVKLRECPLCYDELTACAFPELSLTCGHMSCEECLREYLKIEIGESRVNISCPECKERLHPTDIHKLLKNNMACTAKYEEFMVRRVLVTDPDTRWCPAPDCGYAVIAAGCASCPMLKCQRPGCDTQFCYHCKQEWHANQTCDAARLERFPIMRLSMSDVRNLARTADEYKSCPRCKTMINKMDDGSCNHMTCSICGAQFCWLCLKEASDLHYLSPSGCTFWGKKPWSKKKKILWQLGTLIGAPIGIALIAGLSVPVLIFGLPIWAARKLYQRCKNHNKHKRNAIITFGTIGAFIASPIVAGITIGVPVMLAYVYGVVPYSLCRGGTCGVKTDRVVLSFDFGGSNEETAARGNDGTFLVANPSIGLGSIGENSLTAGFALSASGVQMDRVGLPDDQSDTKSASMRNMAGTSITGSIYEPESSLHQKLEIRADVSLRPAVSVERKNSIDSQTLSQADNRSLRSFGQSDNRSHVSFNVDNASMKAMAGSICAARDKDTVYPPDIPSDVPNKSCMKGEHGSPISNRSVSFATQDKTTKSKKKLSSKRRRELEKADKLSIRSFDTLSNSSANESAPVNKRFSEYKPCGSELAQCGGSELAQRGGSELAQCGGSELAQRGGSELAQRGGSELAQRGVSELAQRGVSEMAQRGVSELAQRGVSEVIHRGSRDSAHMEGSSCTNELTLVEVDQPATLSAASVKPMATANGSSVNEGGAAGHPTLDKALCNIDEVHGHIV